MVANREPMTVATAGEASAPSGTVLGIYTAPAAGAPMVARERVPVVRNLVTRGIDLDALIGRRFRVGAIECYGERPCPPCGYLEKLTGLKGLNRGLTDRGGIRAEILLDGEIAVGDVVALSDIVP